VSVEYKDAERVSGPRPSPGWIWRDEVSGILGMTLTNGLTASILRATDPETPLLKLVRFYCRSGESLSAD
jgi:hypothetical protein